MIISGSIGRMFFETTFRPERQTSTLYFLRSAVDSTDTGLVLMPVECPCARMGLTS